MTIFQLILLAIVQGLTEFLPVSSSAHLVILPILMRWADQGPLIDVMAHVGTLAAVMLYFRKDVAEILQGLFDLLGRNMTPGARLALMLIVATPPGLILAAILFLTGAIDPLRDPVLIAWMNLIFAVPLWAADRFARRDRALADFTLKGAFLTGLAQCLSLLPGVSRSGITMTAARGLGLNRTDAARFSMLMAMPVLACFGAAAGLDLAMDGAAGSLTDGLIVAALSFLTALAAIAALMKLLERISFLPFVIYRIALGVTLIALFGWRIGG